MAGPRRGREARAHGARDARGQLVLRRASRRRARGAHELAERGVGPRTGVAIALPPGLAFAQALHACLLLGAVAVPLDPRSSPAERAISRTARCGAPLDAPLVQPSRRPRCHAPAGARTEHDLDATAVVIHTSGTTSSPRPVELTYGNFLWSALGSAVALGLDPHERWLCALPLAHVGGLSILMRSAIYATTAVVHEGFDTERVLDALRKREITLVSLVATTLARLLDAGLADPPSLRWRADRRRPRAGRARGQGARGGRAGGEHLRPDRGLLAGHDHARCGDRRRGPRARRDAAVLHARAHRARR